MEKAADHVVDAASMGQSYVNMVSFYADNAFVSWRLA